MKKSILITGADGNLGKTITRSMLERGYHVHAAVGPNGSPHFMQHPDLQAQPVELDKPGPTRAWVTEVLEASEGQLVAALCLAGGFTPGGWEQTNTESVQRMIDLNFFTTFHLVQPLMRYFSDSPGHFQFVLISSRAALQPSEGKGLIGYSLSKSMVLRLAEFINEDANQTGVQASVILPSTLDTAATRAAMPEADFGNWVPTERVADTIHFILSDAGHMQRNTVYRLYNRA